MDENRLTGKNKPFLCQHENRIWKSVWIIFIQRKHWSSNLFIKFFNNWQQQKKSFDLTNFKSKLASNPIQNAINRLLYHSQILYYAYISNKVLRVFACHWQSSLFIAIQKSWKTSNSNSSKKLLLLLKWKYIRWCIHVHKMWKSQKIEK